MNFDPSNLSNLVLILTAYAAAFLAALWLSLLVWTVRDVRRRSRDRLARILAALVVLVLFLPGLLIYLILRPSNTLEEEYQQTLEEEALLRAIEDAPLCPGCNRRVQEDWIKCPFCHASLKVTCKHCNKIMDLNWSLCPYCGKTVSDSSGGGLTMGEAIRTLPTSSPD